MNPQNDASVHVPPARVRGTRWVFGCRVVRFFFALPSGFSELGEVFGVTSTELVCVADIRRRRAAPILRFIVGAFQGFEVREGPQLFAAVALLCVVTR